MIAFAKGPNCESDMYIVNLKDEELEQLYDKTFDMILGLFVINDYLNEKENPFR